jgi:ABC-2 type transport system ATP-binding protein
VVGLPLRDSFRILGAIHRMPTVEAATRTEELVERLGLAHLIDVPVRQLSLGERMRGEVPQRLCIARGCSSSTSPLSGWT